MVGTNSALILVDVITDFDFEDGDALFRRSQQTFENLRAFKRRCYEERIHIIYVNDPPKSRSLMSDDLILQITQSERGRWALDLVGRVPMR